MNPNWRWWEELLQYRVPMKPSRVLGYPVVGRKYYGINFQLTQVGFLDIPWLEGSILVSTWISHGGKSPLQYPVLMNTNYIISSMGKLLSVGSIWFHNMVANSPISEISKLFCDLASCMIMIDFIVFFLTMLQFERHWILSHIEYILLPRQHKGCLVTKCLTLYQPYGIGDQPLAC